MPLIASIASNAGYKMVKGASKEEELITKSKGRDP
jgi:hypothetical protein